MIFEKPEAERRVMAVTLSSIKILLLEQGSMSSTSNNRILRGEGGFAPRFFGPLGSSHGKRGASLCASLGRSGCVPWEAAPGWSDDTCPLTCTKPSGEFFLSRNASPEHDVIGINNELELAHACSTA